MSTEELFQVLQPQTAKPSVWSRLGGRAAAGLRALAAGMAASRDYRHLNAMTDGQLRMMGLTRTEIPREIHRRHFADEAWRSFD